MLRLATKLAAKTLSQNEILLKLNRRFILWEGAFSGRQAEFSRESSKGQHMSGKKNIIFVALSSKYKIPSSNKYFDQ